LSQAGKPKLSSRWLNPASKITLMASQFAWNQSHTANNEWLKLIKTFELTYLSGLKQTRKVDLGDPGSSHSCKKENGFIH